MTTTTILLILAAMAARWLPRRLVQASWTSRAPSLAVFAWLALGYTVVIAVVTSGATAVMHWHEAHGVLCTAWRVCFDALTGAHGTWAEVGAVGGLVMSAAVVARLGVGAWLVSVVARLQRTRHLATVRLIGHQSPSLGATVVPHSIPAAYIVPGRRPHMVITSGALEALDPEQTDAVLAHERAHCAGHHHLAAAAAGILARAFRWLPVFRIMDSQVRRLVELHADDVATRTHRRSALAHALVAMRAAPAVPEGSLNGGGHHIVERLQRLLDPPTPLPTHIRSTAVVGLTLLPLTPLMAAVLQLAISSS